MRAVIQTENTALLAKGAMYLQGGLSQAAKPDAGCEVQAGLVVASFLQSPRICSASCAKPVKSDIY